MKCANCGSTLSVLSEDTAFDLKYNKVVCAECFSSVTFNCVCGDDVLQDDGNVVGTRSMCNECAATTAQQLIEYIENAGLLENVIHLFI